MPLNPPLCCFISFFRTRDAYQVLNYHQPESMWCMCVCLDWLLWQRQADNREIKVSHSRSAVNRRLGKGERGQRGMGTDWLENMVRIDRGMDDRSDKWVKSKRRWLFFLPLSSRMEFGPLIWPYVMHWWPWMWCFAPPPYLTSAPSA